MRVSCGSVSVAGSAERSTNRTVTGAHTWIVLCGTQNEHDGVNEAELVAPIAEELARSAQPPTDAQVLDALERMDDAVHRWRLAGRDLWGAGLDFVCAVLGPTIVRITHVGAAAAYQLRLDDRAAAPTAWRLTDEHAWREKPGGAVKAIVSSVGAHPIPRIGIATVARRGAMRLVLVSEAAEAGLDTPLGYLVGVASPHECAERICAEARTRRGGVRPATAIVLDVDAEPAAPYR